VERGPKYTQVKEARNPKGAKTAANTAVKAN